MEFNNNEYRFFYYVVYSGAKGRGCINVKLPYLIKTFENVAELKQQVEEALELQDILIESWILLEG